MRYISTFVLGLALLVGPLACGGETQSDGTNNSGDTRRNLRYLRAAPDSRLVVEVDYVEGWKPRSDVSNQLNDRLGELLNKPDGVAIRNDATLESRGEDHAWTFDELSQLANDTFDHEVSDNAIKIHVLFVDGHHADDSDQQKTLGLAWGFKNIAIFKETIEESCQSSGLAGLPVGGDPCATAVQSVWKHEFGHVFGLVDNKLPMQNGHRDEEHGHHCDNDQCVMYWAYEGPGLFDQLSTRFQQGNEQTIPFDDNCLADIDAAQK